jgi:hypothetical protein
MRFSLRKRLEVRKLREHGSERVRVCWVFNCGYFSFLRNRGDDKKRRIEARFCAQAFSLPTGTEAVSPAPNHTEVEQSVYQSVAQRPTKEPSRSNQRLEPKFLPIPVGQTLRKPWIRALAVRRTLGGCARHQPRAASHRPRQWPHLHHPLVFRIRNDQNHRARRKRPTATAASIPELAARPQR